MGKNLLASAVEFLSTHEGQHTLDEQSLVNECAAHLKTISDISDTAARHISAKAQGEIESNSEACADSFIDIDASTSHTIILKTPCGGMSYAFTASTLRRLMLRHGIPIS